MSDVHRTDMERKVTKRKVSVDVLEDKDLYYRDYGVDPSNPGMQRIEINYVDKEDMEPTDIVDPDQRTIRFTWDGKPCTMHRLENTKKFRYEEDSVYDFFLNYLEEQGYNKILLEAQSTPFQQPKKTCKHPEVMETAGAPLITGNRYESLWTSEIEATEENSPSPESSQQRPGMVFKKKPPPITIRIPDDSVLPTFQQLLREPSYVRYQNQRITVYPATHAEYKEVMREADNLHLEFFTYNPVVLNFGKCILKGLPTSTAATTIQDELQQKHLDITGIRQLTKATPSADGTHVRKPLPLWVLTYNKEHKEALYKLKGLLHFQITIEDLKRQDQALSQCFRCQEYGHKAAFCKQRMVCKTCAGEHDSRSCTLPTSTPPKCHNCKGQHLASAVDCPARQVLLTSLRKRTLQLPRQRPPPPEDFPPLPTMSQNSPSDGGMPIVLELFQVLKTPVIQQFLQSVVQFLKKLSHSPRMLTSIQQLFASLA